MTFHAFGETFPQAGFLPSQITVLCDELVLEESELEKLANHPST